MDADPPDPAAAQEPHQVARAQSPLGELVLRRRFDAGVPVLELRANGLFVMDTAEVTTERALARAALGEVDGGSLSVLVGGLGLGFTLEEVLADPRVRRCVVAEIEPALVAWMGDGTVPHGPALLADPRVEVVVGDVAATVRAAAGASYDVVLLDVDNGPGNLVHTTNAGLYAAGPLGEVARTLRPGGRLVVWSADRSPALAAAIGAAYDTCAERRLPVALQGRDEAYWLYTGAVTSGP